MPKTREQKQKDDFKHEVLDVDLTVLDDDCVFFCLEWLRSGIMTVEKVKSAYYDRDWAQALHIYEQVVEKRAKKNLTENEHPKVLHKTKNGNVFSVYSPKKSKGHFSDNFSDDCFVGCGYCVDDDADTDNIVFFGDIVVPVCITVVTDVEVVVDHTIFIGDVFVPLGFSVFLDDDVIISVDISNIFKLKAKKVDDVDACDVKQVLDPFFSHQHSGDVAIDNVIDDVDETVLLPCEVKLDNMEENDCNTGLMQSELTVEVVMSWFFSWREMELVVEGNGCEWECVGIG